MAVEGEASTDSGTARRSAPALFSAMSQSRSSSAAVRKVGVPPPKAAAAYRTGSPSPPSASRTAFACRSSASRYAVVSPSGAPIRVNRLQNPQRTSQNGMCR